MGAAAVTHAFVFDDVSDGRAHDTWALQEFGDDFGGVACALGFQGHGDGSNMLPMRLISGQKLFSLVMQDWQGLLVAAATGSEDIAIQPGYAGEIGGDVFSSVLGGIADSCQQGVESGRIAHHAEDMGRRAVCLPAWRRRYKPGAARAGRVQAQP